MRAHLIRTRTVRLFVEVYPSGKTAFEDWLALIKAAAWETPGDIKKTFRTADLLGRGSNRVIFNIAGNQFRMICKYAFGESQIHLFICWIGSHAMYDKLCRENKQYTVNLY
jgi:mRNA interferase HigB